MKKLAYLVGIGCLAGILYSCDDEPKNPGDFSTASELNLDTKVVSFKEGVTFELRVASRRDTTYRYEYTINDTVFEYLPNGDSTYVIGSDGKPLVNKRDSFYYSLKTAELIEYEPIVLPSYSDTLTVGLFSNARWTAKQPQSIWFNNYDGTHAGGGDSKFSFSVARNRARMRTVVQEIFTADSMVCALLTVSQSGERD